MKFIFISREGYAQPGGRIRCYGFADELNKRGLSAEVFSFCDHLGAKAGADDVNFTFREKLAFIFKGAHHLLKKKNTVFVINRFNYHTIAAWCAAGVLRNPIIFDMDDWEASDALGQRCGIPHSKSEYLTRILARQSIFCIAASHYLKEYLLQFNKNVYLLPTGVSLEKFKPLPATHEAKEIVFSWHGSINREEVVRCIQYIVECFLIINVEYENTRLQIKGAGSFDVQVKKMLSQYEHSAIEYSGWSHPDTLPEYLDSVDIGLIPLCEESRFNLSKSPTKIFEYMAKKKPVIASNVGEAAHIIEHKQNGLLAAGKDEFILCMRELVEDWQLRQDIAARAYQSIEEKYSLDVIGTALYEIINTAHIL